MKKPTLWFIISSFISHAGFSDTYVWQDYDDFSGSSLDTSKWEIGYWDGAQAPNIENGKAHLYGTGVGVGSIVPPSMDELVGMPQNGTNQSFLFLKDDLIRGVQAEISLDSTFSGIYLGIMEAVEGGFAYAGIELNSWKQSGPSLEFSNTIYENGTETLESTLGDKPANLGQSYKVSVVKHDSAYQLFLDSELIGEYPVRGELLFFSFGGYHDEDLPWDGYIDNVRVITDWEEYDDFSTGSLDSSKWDVSYYAGGKPPVINDGVLELSGTSQEDFNETYLDDSWLGEFPDAISDLGDSGAHSNVGINENLDAIEFEVMMPSSVPEKVGMGLYILDTSTFEGSFDYEARANATRAYADMWYESGNLEVNFGVIGHSTVYIPCSFDTYYRIGVVFEESKICFYLNGEKKAEFEETFTKDYFLIRGTSSESVPFTSYMDNVRVLRRSQDTPAPEPDPVTVVSDPSGNPVVVQVGDEYQWNSTLDGVTLWALGVEEEGVSKKGTAKFENGNKLIVFDIVDEVNGNETYNHPYIVDENGHIRVTESVYQYYNVVGVEDGAIRIIQDSNGLGSVADNGVNQVSMLYFTTRAAAEEYYYSKVNPKNWMWFDHYPWVYSEEEGDWLYFYPSDGTLIYWSNKGQAWRQFN